MTKLDSTYNEIKKFSEQASKWWDISGPAKALHAFNPVRINFINQFCDLKSAKVLDLGCGAGILSEALSVFGANVTGVDASNKMIEVAKKHAKVNNLNIEYLNYEYQDFYKSYKDTKYDVIVCMELAEHVESFQDLIDTCSKLLNPNGILFLSTINRTFKSYLHAILGAEYVLKILPKGTHDYTKFIRPATLNNTLIECNLKLEQISGISYNPITNFAKLINNCDVNYILAAKVK